MKPPKFHVGQAVVCLGGNWDFPPEGAQPPQKNAIYTVSAVDYGRGWNQGWWKFWRRKYFIELAEMPRHSWAANRFAPVELLPDEALAELKELLEPVTV